MLFINFAGKGTNKRVIIQIYTVFLSFLTVFISLKPHQRFKGFGDRGDRFLILW